VRSPAVPEVTTPAAPPLSVCFHGVLRPLRVDRHVGSGSMTATAPGEPNGCNRVATAEPTIAIQP
jgi:hypothetical protein